MAELAVVATPEVAKADANGAAAKMAVGTESSVPAAAIESLDLQLPDLQIFDGSTIDVGAAIEGGAVGPAVGGGDGTAGAAVVVAPVVESVGAGSAIAAAKELAEAAVAAIEKPADSKKPEPEVWRPMAGGFCAVKTINHPYLPDLSAQQLADDIQEKSIEVAGLAADWQRKQLAAKKSKKRIRFGGRGFEGLTGTDGAGQYGLPFSGAIVDTLANADRIEKSQSIQNGPLARTKGIADPRDGVNRRLARRNLLFPKRHRPTAIPNAWKSVPLLRNSASKASWRNPSRKPDSQRSASLAEFTAADKRLTDLAGIGAREGRRRSKN